MKLKCVNLCAGYGEKSILRNVDFSVIPGDFVCLCGPNGSGKSTLLSVLAGLPENTLKITSGEVLLDEKPLSSFTARERAKKIAYMQQTEYSEWDFSVYDFVLQGRFAYSKNGWYSKEDEKKAENCLNELGLSDFVLRKIHSLSGGEFQKVRIARAMTQEPEFMLLDEPAANLDFVYEPKLLEFLRNLAEKKHIGIILSIHDVNLAALYAKRIALLSPIHSTISPSSKAAATSPETSFLIGDTENVFTRENLSQTFGTALQTYVHQVYNKIQVTNEK